jgi:hypothetical protein
MRGFAARGRPRSSRTFALEKKRPLHPTCGFGDREIISNTRTFLRVLGLVNLDARLVRGLDRLNEGAGPDIRNQSFSLMLGYYSFGAPGF